MPSLAECTQLHLSGDETASLAPSTRARVSVVLNALMDVAGRKIMASKLNRTHVDKAVARWRSEGLPEVSTNNYKTSLPTFTAHVFENRYNRTDIGKHLKPLKTATHYAKRKPLTKPQVAKILELAEAFHPRAYICAPLCLALALAVRESECPVDWSRCRPRQPRHLRPASEDTGDLGPSSKRPVLRRVGDLERGLRATPSEELRERLQKYFKMAGRTSAELLLGSGASMRDVMHLLGHTMAQMTTQYIDRDAEREQLTERVRSWTI